MSKRKKNRKRNYKRKSSSKHIFRTIVFVMVYSYFILKIKGEYEIVPLLIGTIYFLFPVLLDRLKMRYLRYKYLNSPLEKIDKMKGEEFEEYLAAYFHSQGYKVEMTPKSNDYGADLILHKGGITTVVQAKRYNATIGNAAIQQIVGAKAYYGAQEAMVVTNSHFSSNAFNLAQCNNVKLIDRNQLYKNKQLKI